MSEDIPAGASRTVELEPGQKMAVVNRHGRASRITITSAATGLEVLVVLPPGAELQLSGRADDIEVRIDQQELYGGPGLTLVTGNDDRDPGAPVIDRD